MHSGWAHEYHLAIRSDFHRDLLFLIAQSDSRILKVKGILLQRRVSLSAARAFDIDIHRLGNVTETEYGRSSIWKKFLSFHVALTIISMVTILLLLSSITEWQNYVIRSALSIAVKRKGRIHHREIAQSSPQQQDSPSSC